MKLLKSIFYVLYRIWFYILLTVPILAMSPFLIVSTLKASWYPTFFKMARIWATIILYGMGFLPKVKRHENYQKGQSYMFVSNHTSMTDIMLMLYIVKNPFVFVGKVELGRIPIFGFFYKRTCILVDRSDSRSRLNVFKSAQEKLDQGYGVCIFPEGGVPEDLSVVLDTFKDGAFRLAIEHHISVAPMTFHDNKERFSYEFFSGSPGQMRATVHPVIPTSILEMEDKRMLKNQVREIILEELTSKK